MYARLDSPLPNLTVSPDGCHSCGMRGLPVRRSWLGDDVGIADPTAIDTTPTDNYGDLLPPEATPVAVPTNTISPIIDLPLSAPGAVGPSLSSMYPDTVGTEFVSNGDGTYTNIQTGQSVPYSIAQEVTAATAPPANLSTTSSAPPAAGTLTIADVVDPTTGTNYSGTLTAAAQALQATGQLITAAGKLTPAGQALAAQGQLVAPPSGSVTAALASLSSWFSAQSLMTGVPNGVILGGAVIALVVVSSMMGGKKKRR